MLLMKGVRNLCSVGPAGPPASSNASLRGFVTATQRGKKASENSIVGLSKALKHGIAFRHREMREKELL